MILFPDNIQMMGQCVVVDVSVVVFVVAVSVVVFDVVTF